MSATYMILSLLLLTGFVMDTMSFRSIAVRGCVRGRSLFDSSTLIQQKTLKASPKTTTAANSSKTQTSDSGETNKVFLGNLPFTITEEFIKELVESKMGKNLVLNINIIRGSKSKRPMGILFIDFVDPDTAARAVALLDGYDLDGRILNSNLKYPEDTAAKSKSDKKTAPPLRIPNTIYLSNLDYALSEEELYNMCDDLVWVGLVREVRIPKDKNTGSPRGFAYIEFKSATDVELAINELTNVEVYGRLLRAERMVPPPKKDKVLSEEDQERDFLDEF